MKHVIILILTVLLSITAFAQVDSIYTQRLDKIQEIQLIREQINSLLIALPTSQNPHLDREIYKSLVSELLKKEEEYYNFLFLQTLQSHPIKWIIRFNLEE